MTRLRADILLLLVAVIWGAAFVTQKTGMDGLGPLSFVAARFLLSLLVVLPFVWRELRHVTAPVSRGDCLPVGLLCAVFVAGVILQQTGMVSTSVTNAGFLTGLYVVMVPFAVWIIRRKKPAWIVWPAGIISVFGVWLLNGASLSRMVAGDWLVLGCAFFFALHLVFMAIAVDRTSRPVTLAALQYAVCLIVAGVAAFMFETPSWAALAANAPQLFYAGVISGGIAYTLQAVAQRHTPASDAAVILSGEALFAALAGAVFLGDRLDTLGWAGCGLILLAILLVELGALWWARAGRITA